MEHDHRLGAHYAVKIEHAAPTKIWCNCGAVFEGNDCIDLMKMHMKLHDDVTEAEKELERRNVFDLGKDTDEENP